MGDAQGHVYVNNRMEVTVTPAEDMFMKVADWKLFG